MQVCLGNVLLFFIAITFFLGMDLSFVKAGLAILRPGGSLFSLHKSSTRDHILKTANKWENADVSLGTMAYFNQWHGFPAFRQDV